MRVLLLFYYIQTYLHSNSECERHENREKGEGLGTWHLHLLITNIGFINAK